LSSSSVPLLSCTLPPSPFPPSFPSFPSSSPVSLLRLSPSFQPFLPPLPCPHPYPLNLIHRTFCHLYNNTFVTTIYSAGAPPHTQAGELPTLSSQLGPRARRGGRTNVCPRAPKTLAPPLTLSCLSGLQHVSRVCHRCMHVSIIPVF